MATNPVTIIFNWSNYKKAAKAGHCIPPGVFVPFINVDPKKYNDLREEMGKFDLSEFEKRYGQNMFNQIRGAVGLSLRHARMFFPAYQFLVYEILNLDWHALVGTKSYHRDHVIHQPMSVYVGLSLLKGCDISCSSNGSMTFSGKSLLDHCVDMMAKSPKCQYLRDYFENMGGDSRVFGDDSPYYEMYRKDLFLDTFFLATLFHDIGYPWNFVTKISDKIKDQFSTGKPINKKSEHFALINNERLFLYPLRGYKGRDVTAPFSWPKDFVELVDTIMAETHGLPGAIALLNMNDYIRKYPLDEHEMPSRRFCLEWAAMAVMMHDMAKIYAKIGKDGKLDRLNPHLRLSLSRDPLSFMLTLTDQVQEFGRPDAHFKGNNYSAIVTYRSRCNNVNVKWNEGTGLFEIIYKYESYRDYSENRFDYLPKRQLLYFDPFEGYLDYSDIGIRQVKLEAVLKSR